jgi:hypothetical protein
MNAFKVLISRVDGASCLRVDGFENTNWLIRRLSDFFVFKTCEPLREVMDGRAFAFRLQHNSQLSASQIERLLNGLSEVKLTIERASTTSASEASALQ